ncbi:MAG: hypothetical protein DWQ07_15365 [Chloroflexi bacterium]|nr:MAG: hypothetical protein DWQ07_15365 [Chloroflexota bacterium]
MPTLDDAFPKPHLKSVDLQGEPRLATIKRVTRKALWDHKTQSQRPQWVVFFHEYAKYLILNQTIGEAIASVAGDREFSQWVGAKVVLYPTQEDSFGDTWDVIRVRAPQPGEFGGRQKRQPKSKKDKLLIKDWPADVVDAIVKAGQAETAVEAVAALNMSELTLEQARQWAGRWMAYFLRLQTEKEYSPEAAADAANRKLAASMDGEAS